MSRDVVCCLTPAGSAALAVIGLRGPNVWSKLSPWFSSRRQPVLSETPRMYLGQLERDGVGDQIVLVLQGTEAHQEIELQLHGGPGVVAWCMQFARELGCEKIDWPDWHDEARWKLLPLAATRKLAGILLDQSPAAWEAAVGSIRDRMRQPRADCRQLLAEVETLQSWESLADHLVEPWKIVLAGSPNAGKSSLLNAIVGFDRAITDPTPGTTRDLVAADVAWEGWLLQFIDTAGLRESDNALEREGMERSRAAGADADLLLWLMDLSQPPTAVPDDIRPAFLVGTKSDLPRVHDVPVDFTVSSLRGEGIGELLAGLVRKLVPKEPAPGQVMPITLAQKEELRCLRQYLTEKPA